MEHKQKLEMVYKLREMADLLENEINCELVPENVKQESLVIQCRIIRNIINSVIGIPIQSKNRARDYVNGRYIYYVICSKYTRASLNTIGNEVNVDHSSVINGKKKHNVMIATKGYEYYQRLFNTITKQIRKKWEMDITTQTEKRETL